MITKEQFLNDTDEDEVFSLIESFFVRWIDEIKKEDVNYPQTKEDLLRTAYQYLPTDQEKIVLIRDIIKNN